MPDKDTEIVVDKLTAMDVFYKMVKGRNLYMAKVIDFTKELQRKEEVRTSEFRFTKSEEEFLSGNGICIESMLNLENTQMYQAAFLGRCMTLFGEPNITSDDHEALYSYYIIAEDENGKKANLEIYFGSGGPSIGVGDSEWEKQAAIELAKAVLAAEPKDYKIQSSYDDTGVKIIMGVENGEPFYKTLFPGMTEDMSPEEMMEAMAKMFK